MPSPRPLIHCRLLSRLALFFLILLLCPPSMGSAKESAILLPPQDQIPPLRDDMDHKSLITAATRHLGYLRALPPTAALRVEGAACSRQCLLESMETFLAILQQNPDPAQLDQAIRDNFTLYQAAAEPRKKAGKC